MEAPLNNALVDYGHEVAGDPGAEFSLEHGATGRDDVSLCGVAQCFVEDQPHYIVIYNNGVCARRRRLRGHSLNGEVGDLGGELVPVLAFYELVPRAHGLAVSDYLLHATGFGHA